MDFLYDVAIKNGDIIDPLSGNKEKKNIYIKDGVFVACHGSGNARYSIDATGKYVMPGLIDAHAHVYMGGSDVSVNPATVMVHQGITTVVDAGTAGTGTLLGLIGEMATAPLRIKAFLNVSPSGLATSRRRYPVDPADWDRSRMIQAFREHGDKLLGLKFMAGKERINDLGPLKACVTLADELNVPIAVHCTNPPESMAKLAGMLRKGDILAHCYHGKGSSIIDDNGKVRPEVKAARERGVVMDASNGFAHFSYSVAEAAMGEGFFPDIIATDLTAVTLYKEPVFGLPHIMSKYLMLGMPLMEVVRCCTSRAAEICCMSDRLGNLRTEVWRM